MSNLKSKPPGQNQVNLNAFLTGAEQRTTVTTIPIAQASYPWEEAGVREDVIKVYNLRLPEAYLMKLKYISENTPDSMQKFCLTVLCQAIDQKVQELAR